jgi:steroid delta-isomerase-like uncharacterized protein
MMSAEENKAIVREWIEAVWSNHDLDRVEDFYAPNYTLNGEPQSIPRIKENLASVFSAFPDLRTTIDDMIAEGDTVAYRFTWRGTHQGELKETPFGPISATGKPFTLNAITYVRLANGKIAEDWGQFDSLKFFQLLGVVPTPA